MNEVIPLNRQMPEISSCCLCLFYTKIQDAIVLPTGIFAMAYTWLLQARQGNMPLPQAQGRGFLLPDGGNCSRAGFQHQGIYAAGNPLPALRYAWVRHTEHAGSVRYLTGAV